MDENLKKLMVSAMNNQAVAEYSNKDVEDSLRSELKELSKNPMAYERNKHAIFELLQIAVDEVLPKKVMSIFEMWADVQILPQGQKATFKKKLGRKRAKTFITQVSPAGKYESFRLDAESFQLAVGAVGASARLDWERYLDGQENMSEIVDIILEGIEEAIYRAIYEQLMAAYNTNGLMPAANKGVSAGVDATILDRIISVIESYGNGVVIFCSKMFAAGLDNQIKKFELGAEDKADVRKQGYVGMYKGSPVVILPNATEDETNTEWAFDPSFCFILPTGGEKPVKLVLEGDLQVKDVPTADWSMEMEFYKKFGSAVLFYNNIGIYKNSSLSKAIV